MRMNTLVIIVFILSISILMMSLTYLVIAKTSLKEYIPGYPNVDQRKQVYELNLLADSLLYDIQQKDRYIQNVKNILEDRVPEKLYGTACRWLHSEYLYRLVEGTGGPGR